MHDERVLVVGGVGGGAPVVRAHEQGGVGGGVAGVHNQVLVVEDVAGAGGRLLEEARAHALTNGAEHEARAVGGGRVVGYALRAGRDAAQQNLVAHGAGDVHLGDDHGGDVQVVVGRLHGLDEVAVHVVGGRKPRLHRLAADAQVVGRVVGFAGAKEQGARLGTAAAPHLLKLHGVDAGQALVLHHDGRVAVDVELGTRPVGRTRPHVGGVGVGRIGIDDDEFVVHNAVQAAGVVARDPHHGWLQQTRLGRDAARRAVVDEAHPHAAVGGGIHRIADGIVVPVINRDVQRLSGAADVAGQRVGNAAVGGIHGRVGGRRSQRGVHRVGEVGAHPPARERHRNHGHGQRAGSAQGVGRAHLHVVYRGRQQAPQRRRVAGAGRSRAVAPQGEGRGREAVAHLGVAGVLGGEINGEARRGQVGGVGGGADVGQAGQHQVGGQARQHLVAAPGRGDGRRAGKLAHDADEVVGSAGGRLAHQAAEVGGAGRVHEGHRRAHVAELVAGAARDGRHRPARGGGKAGLAVEAHQAPLVLLGKGGAHGGQRKRHRSRLRLVAGHYPERREGIDFIQPLIIDQGAAHHDGVADAHVVQRRQEGIAGSSVGGDAARGVL